VIGWDGRCWDCLREIKSPFDPESAIDQFVHDLRRYRVRYVKGDRYGGEWPRQRFRIRGIDYKVSDETKSDLYLACLPLLMAGRVELLESERLTAQFLGRERRTSRGGKDSIDHAPGRKDDLSNAAAGSLVQAAAEAQSLFGVARSRWLS
jgi:hypothetical protein